MGKLKVSLLVCYTVVCLPIVGRGQLASWPLSADGNATGIDPQITAGVFSGSSGIGSLSFGSTGAYATGWTTNSGPDPTDYFQVSLAPLPGKNLTITAINFSERRSLTGIRNYELRSSTDPAFSTYTVLATQAVPDDDLERSGNLTGLNLMVNSGDTLYIRWYGYAAEGGTGSWRINDNTLKVEGLVSAVNPNDNSSIASAPASQVSGGVILSTATSPGSAVEVLRFIAEDPGSGDGLSTEIRIISITNTGSNNWSSILSGVVLEKDGSPLLPDSVTISASQMMIFFGTGDNVIADGSQSDYSLSIFLTGTGITDGDTLAFGIIAANPGWDSYMTGSGFSATFPADILSPLFTIDVQATELRFVYVPTTVWANQDFLLAVVATDDAGNTDTGYTGLVTISKDLGGGNLTSVYGLSQSAVNGNLTWTDLRYNQDGYFSIRATGNGTGTVTTPIILAVEGGQNLNESFTDGDFSNNPAWFGETGDFVINPLMQLQLFTSIVSSDTSWLVTPVSLNPDSTEWQIYMDLLLDPSDNNNVRFYLMSDQPDLSGPLQGYYVLFGENGSADAAELFYQDGSTMTSVCRGTDGLVALSPEVRVKVVRYSDGTWKLYMDPTGGSGFEFQAAGTNNSFTASVFYTGVFCKYSSSNDEGKFNFDDVYCGPVQVDTIAPQYSSLIVVDSLHLDLAFSESISLADATTLSNFSVDNAIGNPVSASRDASDYALVHLTFNTAFQSGTNYLLAFPGIRDLSGNALTGSASASFVWYDVMPYDVVINEIMADPSPAVSLPEFEYVELFNRTAYPVSLAGWTLTAGSSTLILSTVTIAPQGYAIIAGSSAVTALSAYGTVVEGLSSTTSLTNSGLPLVLKNKDGRIISSVEYSDNWYQNGYKDDGGWSLEQIDAANPCAGIINWKASADLSGGTPGRQNSVAGSNPDNLAPRLKYISCIAPDTLNLFFSEVLDSAAALNPLTYTADHGLGNPIAVFSLSGSYDRIRLVLPQALLADTIYKLTLTDSIFDCVGNTVGIASEYSFALPSPCDSNDLIINEVLFDPITGGVDYVELYNRSSKNLDMRELRLAELDITGLPAGLFPLAAEGFPVFPGEYVLLSEDGITVKSQYYCPYPDRLLDVENMPDMGSESGRVSLVNQSFSIIDDFSYSTDMQFQMLNSFDGVALERISPSLTSNDPRNWHSAAENVGFGTPGYKNSQFNLIGIGSGEITLEPETFSPDNDGYNDILYISYKFEEPGYMAIVIIFDARGRKIRSLASNEMLSSEGLITWDGLNDSKNKAAIGIYVIFVEVYNLNGNVMRYKKPCVVAGRISN